MYRIHDIFNNIKSYNNKSFSKATAKVSLQNDWLIFPHINTEFRAFFLHDPNLQ